MNTKTQLNLLLSDILKTDYSPSNGFHRESSSHPLSSLTFSEHDYHPSSILPTTTIGTSSSSSLAPQPPRRNSSLLKHRRQRSHIHDSGLQEQEQQPLLNSSTLDDLFRALTLECEQYLAASSTASYTNGNYNPLMSQSSTITQKNVDSNDEDYENLHTTKLPLSNSITPLKTSIQVVSPAKRQVVSISVSSKINSSPTVSSSKTYPSLSTSCAATSQITTVHPYSSEDDSVDLSSSSTIRRRRRRVRKHPIVSSTTRSSSSSDEGPETTNGSFYEKKSNISKRSYSTDHRQQRIKSIYDNQPASLPPQKLSTRRIRRRDVSLQQPLPFPTEYRENILTKPKDNLCSPLSVLLTSSQTTSDFIDRSQQQQRRSRLELVNPKPLTLLDRLHNQFYRASPTHSNNHNNNNIPSHRIPSYPVY